MNCSTNVPYWVIALKVGCVLSQVIAASGGLSYWSIELDTLASIPCETNGTRTKIALCIDTLTTVHSSQWNQAFH